MTKTMPVDLMLEFLTHMEYSVKYDELIKALEKKKRIQAQLKAVKRSMADMYPKRQKPKKRYRETPEQFLERQKKAKEFTDKVARERKIHLQNQERRRLLEIKKLEDEKKRKEALIQQKREFEQKEKQRRK